MNDFIDDNIFENIYRDIDRNTEATQNRLRARGVMEGSPDWNAALDSVADAVRKNRSRILREEAIAAGKSDAYANYRASAYNNAFDVMPSAQWEKEKRSAWEAEISDIVGGTYRVFEGAVAGFVGGAANWLYEKNRSGFDPRYPHKVDIDRYDGLVTKRDQARGMRERAKRDFEWYKSMIGKTDPLSGKTYTKEDLPWADEAAIEAAYPLPEIPQDLQNKIDYMNAPERGREPLDLSTEISSEVVSVMRNPYYSPIADIGASQLAYRNDPRDSNLKSDVLQDSSGVGKFIGTVAGTTAVSAPAMFYPPALAAFAPMGYQSGQERLQQRYEEQVEKARARGEEPPAPPSVAMMKSAGLQGALYETGSEGVGNAFEMAILLRKGAVGGNALRRGARQVGEMGADSTARIGRNVLEGLSRRAGARGAIGALKATGKVAKAGGVEALEEVANVAASVVGIDTMYDAASLERLWEESVDVAPVAFAAGGVTGVGVLAAERVKRKAEDIEIGKTRAAQIVTRTIDDIADKHALNRLTHMAQPAMGSRMANHQLEEYKGGSRQAIVVDSRHADVTITPEVKSEMENAGINSRSPVRFGNLLFYTNDAFVEDMKNAIQSGDVQSITGVPNYVGSGDAVAGVYTIRDSTGQIVQVVPFGANTDTDSMVAALTAKAARMGLTVGEPLASDNSRLLADQLSAQLDVDRVDAGRAPRQSDKATVQDVRTGVVNIRAEIEAFVHQRERERHEADEAQRAAEAKARGEPYVAKPYDGKVKVTLRPVLKKNMSAGERQIAAAGSPATILEGSVSITRNGETVEEPIPMDGVYDNQISHDGVFLIRENGDAMTFRSAYVSSMHEGMHRGMSRSQGGAHWMNLLFNLDPTFALRNGASYWRKYNPLAANMTDAEVINDMIARYEAAQRVLGDSTRTDAERKAARNVMSGVQRFSEETVAETATETLGTTSALAAEYETTYRETEGVSARKFIAWLANVMVSRGFAGRHAKAVLDMVRQRAIGVRESNLQMDAAYRRGAQQQYEKNMREAAQYTEQLRQQGATEGAELEQSSARAAGATASLRGEGGLPMTGEVTAPPDEEKKPAKDAGQSIIPDIASAATSALSALSQASAQIIPSGTMSPRPRPRAATTDAGAARAQENQPSDTTRASMRRTLRGEWWFTDSGPQFADGDIGDRNHEMIAAAQAIYDFNDYLRRAAEKSRSKKVKERARAFDAYVEQGADLGYDPLEAREQALAAMNVDIKNVSKWVEKEAAKQPEAERAQFKMMVDSVTNELADNREYGLAKGWARVHGNNIQLPRVDDGALKQIADQLYEAEGEQVLDQEFTIEDTANRRVFEGVPFEALERGISGIMPYRSMFSMRDQATGQQRMDQVLPPLPETAPIPEGMQRRFHVTTASPEEIRSSGLLMSKARGIEGPKAVYSWPDYKSAKSYAGTEGKASVVEFMVDPKKMENGMFQFSDVPTSDILAIHEPWHDRLRYAIDNNISEQDVRDAGETSGDQNYIKAADAMRSMFSMRDNAEETPQPEWDVRKIVGQPRFAQTLGSEIPLGPTQTAENPSQSRLTLLKRSLADAIQQQTPAALSAIGVKQGSMTLDNWANWVAASEAGIPKDQLRFVMPWLFKNPLGVETGPLFTSGAKLTPLQFLAEMDAAVPTQAVARVVGAEGSYDQFYQGSQNDPNYQTVDYTEVAITLQFGDAVTSVGDKYAPIIESLRLDNEAAKAEQARLIQAMRDRSPSSREAMQEAVNPYFSEMHWSGTNQVAHYRIGVPVAPNVPVEEVKDVIVHEMQSLHHSKAAENRLTTNPSKTFAFVSRFDALPAFRSESAVSGMQWVSEGILTQRETTPNAYANALKSASIPHMSVFPMMQRTLEAIGDSGDVVSNPQSVRNQPLPTEVNEASRERFGWNLLENIRGWVGSPDPVDLQATGQTLESNLAETASRNNAMLEAAREKVDQILALTDVPNNIFSALNGLSTWWNVLNSYRENGTTEQIAEAENYVLNHPIGSVAYAIADMADSAMSSDPRFADSASDLAEQRSAAVQRVSDRVFDLLNGVRSSRRLNFYFSRGRWDPSTDQVTVALFEAMRSSLPANVAEAIDRVDREMSRRGLDNDTMRDAHRGAVITRVNEMQYNSLPVIIRTVTAAHLLSRGVADEWDIMREYPLDDAQLIDEHVSNFFRMIADQYAESMIASVDPAAQFSPFADAVRIAVAERLAGPTLTPAKFEVVTEGLLPAVSLQFGIVNEAGDDIVANNFGRLHSQTAAATDMTPTQVTAVRNSVLVASRLFPYFSNAYLHDISQIAGVASSDQARSTLGQLETRKRGESIRGEQFATESAENYDRVIWLGLRNLPHEGTTWAEAVDAEVLRYPRKPSPLTTRFTNERSDSFKLTNDWIYPVLANVVMEAVARGAIAGNRVAFTLPEESPSASFMPPQSSVAAYGWDVIEDSERLIGIMDENRVVQAEHAPLQRSKIPMMQKVLESKRASVERANSDKERAARSKGLYRQYIESFLQPFGAQLVYEPYVGPRDSKPLGDKPRMQIVLNDAIIDAAKRGSLTPMFSMRRGFHGAVDAIRMRFTDERIELRRYVDEQRRRNGGNLPDNHNPYQGSRVMSARVAAQVGTLNRRYSTLIYQMDQQGIDLDMMGDFLTAQHARERNEHIRTINPAMPDGGSGMTDAEADLVIANHRAQGSFAEMERFANQWRAILREGLTQRLASGLITQATFNRLTSMYSYYVPLRGRPAEPFDEDFEGGTAFGRGLSTSGRGMPQALGRQSRAMDVVSQIGFVAEDTVRRVERNNVGNRFLRLVMAVNDVGMAQVYRPTRRAEVDGEVRPVYDWQWTGDERNFGLYLNQPEVINGEQYNAGDLVVIRLNNARLQQGMTASQDMGALASALSLPNNWFRTMTTGLLSPAFAAKNLARDLLTGTIQNYSRHGVLDTVAQTVRWTPAFLRVLADEWRGLGPQGSYADFVNAGGDMAFVRGNDLSQKVEEFNRIAESVRRGNPDATSIIRYMTGWYPAVFKAAETATRLAHFNQRRSRFARGGPMNDEQAALSARDVTVDFSKKGTWGRVLNHTHIYMNAGIQGSVNTLKAVGASRDLIPLLVGIGFVQSVLARLNAGDDDELGVNRWDTESGYDKAAYFYIYKPDKSGEFIRIPQPYGFNVFTTLGSDIADAVYGDRTKVSDIISNFVDNSTNYLNPFGGSGITKGFENMVSFAFPTLLRWMPELALNKDFAGRPIYPDQPFGAETTQAYRSFENTPEIYRDAAEALAQAGGGNIIDPPTPEIIDIHPDTLEYMVGVMFSGLGRTLQRAYATSTGEGESRDRPIIGAFRGSSAENDRFVVREYNALKREGQIEQARIAAMRKPNIDLGNIGTLDVESAAIGQEISSIDDAIRRIREMSKIAKTPEEKERLRQMRMQLMRGVVSRANRARGS